MTPKQLHKFLTTAIPKKRSVLIKGPPGIGKSDCVAAAAKEVGANLLLMHPAISDPTDFKGMPCLTPNGEAHFLPFGDLSALCKAQTLTVCFQDDIGQASPAVQAALMQLNLARAVNGLAISSHVVFIGATNEVGQMAGVSGMIEPLKSRWETIVCLQPDVPGWLEWAEMFGLPKDLREFIKGRPQLLSDFKPTKQITNSPSPRGWAAVGRWMNDGVIDLEVFSGAVGEGPALELLSHLDNSGRVPDPENIIANPTSARVPKEPSVRYALCAALARLATTKNIVSIITFLDRLPEEVAMAGMKAIAEHHPKLKDTSSYQAWMEAHIASGKQPF